MTLDEQGLTQHRTGDPRGRGAEPMTGDRDTGGPSTGRDVRLRLPPSSSSAHAARAAVRQHLDEAGRTDLSEDVALVVTELVANAVLHARTEMTVTAQLHGDGLRVAVADGSDVLPHRSTSSPTSVCGRGLPLVARLSASWGVEALPEGGKRVWAQLDAACAVAGTSSADDLLESWTDEPWPVQPEVSTGVDVAVDVAVHIDVQAMLDSRAHTEDLVRDLQLSSLSVGAAVDAGTASPGETTLVGLARRLDAANEQFRDARRQMFEQTVGAARRGQQHTTLHLRLQRADSARARRWLAALEEADQLTADGTLLLPPFPPGMRALRHHYIGAIVDRLEAIA